MSASDWESKGKKALVGSHYGFLYQHKDTKRYKYIVYINGQEVHCPTANTQGDAYASAATHTKGR